MDLFFEQKACELTREERSELSRIFGKLVNKINGIPVSLDFRRTGADVYFSHPCSTSEIFLGTVKSEETDTVGDFLGKISSYKIEKMARMYNGEDREKLLAIYARFEGNENLDLYIDKCCVCYETTDFSIACKHYVCPHCLARVTKCPLCRGTIDANTE